MCIYISQGTFTYIKLQKDPKSYKLPLGDSKMQSPISLICSTQPFQDKAAQTE